MKVLIVEPGKAPYEAELDGSLRSMQEAVGGGIESNSPYEDPAVIISNRDGKNAGLTLNRAVYGQDGSMTDIIAGTFFIAGLGEESFTDLPDYLMEKSKEQFKHPEKFIRLAGEVVVAKQPLPPEEQTRPGVMEEPDGEGVRLDESVDLAFDLDEFFRRNSRNYAAIFRDPHERKECLADKLLSGQTAQIRDHLASLEKNHPYLVGDLAALLERIAAYEKKYGIMSLREQLDSARKQAAQTAQRVPEKTKKPERG